MSERLDRMRKAVADMNAATNPADRAAAREAAIKDYDQATEDEKNQLFPHRPKTWP